VEFHLKFQPEAIQALEELKQTHPKKLKKVLKTLGLMETNLCHPSLQTHKYSNLQGSNKEQVFESYVENNTPGAFRVFWYYGPEQRVITILAITLHP